MISASIAYVAAALAVSPASAGTASSAAYSLLVGLQVTPVGFPLATVNIGPVALANGTAPPAYASNATVVTSNATANLITSPALDANLTAATGLLINNASGSTNAPAFAHADSTTNALAIDAVATPLVGLSTDLASLGAQTITSSADVAGSFGALTRKGTSNIEGLTLTGLLGADLATLGLNLGLAANAAPNTVLLSAPGVFAIANEQVLRGNLSSSAGITVNALRISFTTFDALGVGLLNGEIIVGQSVADLSVDRIATPEPAIFGLFGFGLLAMATATARRSR